MEAAGGAQEAEDASAALLQEILKHERELRDRNTALSVPGKRFTRALEVAAAALKQLDPSKQSLPGGVPPQKQVRTLHLFV